MDNTTIAGVLDSQLAHLNDRLSALEAQMDAWTQAVLIRLSVLALSATLIAVALLLERDHR